MSTPDRRSRRYQAESSDSGWLGLFFGEDEQNRRRTILAVACAIALNAIAIGIIIGFQSGTQTNANEVVTKVAIVRETTPRPTPTPKPKPPPKKVIAIAPLTDPGKSARVEPIKRVAAARPKTVTKYHSKQIDNVILTGGQGAGAGNKTDAGSIATGGTGKGVGTEGSGSGGICGKVDFVKSRSASYDATTKLYTYDNIEMIVYYSDGTAKTIDLDYPWHYRDEAMDPFNHPDAPMWFQYPPRAMRATEPPEVQYIMAHSTIEGSTELDPCPAQP